MTVFNFAINPMVVIASRTMIILPHSPENRHPYKCSESPGGDLALRATTNRGGLRFQRRCGTSLLKEVVESDFTLDYPGVLIALDAIRRHKRQMNGLARSCFILEKLRPVAKSLCVCVADREFTA